MIIEDPHRPPAPQKKGFTDQVLPSDQKVEDLPLAQPWDRVAAVVFDFALVLGPIALLATSYHRKQMRLASFLGDTNTFGQSAFAISMITFVLLVLYWSLATSIFGASVGQFILKIRVRQIWQLDEVPLWSSFSRSFWFLLQAGLGFLPSLMAFADPSRRLLHDRLTDTLVVTVDTERKAQKTPVQQTYLYRGFVLANLLVIFGLGSLVFFDWSQGLRSKKGLTAYLEQQDELCSEVGKALEEAEVLGVFQERLSSVLALYAAGEVEKDCLSKEVAFHLNQNFESEGSLYLAQSFIKSKDADLSNLYLDQVCQSDAESEDCLLSEVVKAWSDENWPEVRELFGSRESFTEPHLQIWASRFFFKVGEPLRALAFLEQLPKLQSLARFVSIQRVKGLWSAGQFRLAQESSEVAYGHLGELDRLDLAAWLCLEEVEVQCESINSRSCKRVVAGLKKQPGFLEDPRLAVTQLRLNECQSTPDQGASGSLLSGTSVVEPLTLVLNSKSSTLKRRVAFKQISLDSELPDSVRDEAELRGFELSLQTEASQRIQDWSLQAPDLMWFKRGKRLLEHFASHRQPTEAVRVSSLLNQYFPEYRRSYEVSARSWFQLGNFAESYKALIEFDRLESQLPSRRGPGQKRQLASENSHTLEPLRSQLESWFQRKSERK